MPIAVILEPPLTLFFLQLFHTFYSRCWCVRGFYSVLSLVYNSSETRGTWIFSWHDKLETVLRSNGLRTSLFVFGFIVDWVRAVHTQAWAQHRGLYVSWSWHSVTLWQVTIIMTPMATSHTSLCIWGWPSKWPLVITFRMTLENQSWNSNANCSIKVIIWHGIEH